MNGCCCDHCLLLHRWSPIELTGQTEVLFPRFLGQNVSGAGVDQHLNDNLGAAYRMVIEPPAGWAGTLGIRGFRSNGDTLASVVLDGDRLFWAAYNATTNSWDPLFQGRDEPFVVDLGQVTYPLTLYLSFQRHLSPLTPYGPTFLADRHICNVYANGTMVGRFRVAEFQVQSLGTGGAQWRINHLHPTWLNPSPSATGTVNVSDFEGWLTNKSTTTGDCFSDPVNVYWDYPGYNPTTEPAYTLSGAIDSGFNFAGTWDQRNDYYDQWQQFTSLTIGQANGFLSGWTGPHTTPESPFFSYDFAITSVRRTVNDFSFGQFHGAYVRQDIGIAERINNLSPAPVNMLGGLSFITPLVDDVSQPVGGTTQVLAQAPAGNLEYVLNNLLGTDFQTTQA